MGIYSADGLVQFTEEEMFNLPEGKMTVVFSDGSRIITTKRRTIYSWFFWRLHREYPGCEVKPRHHVGNIQIKKGLEMTLGATVFWDVYDESIEHKNPENYPKQDLIWRMSETFYQITNAMHNMVVSKLCSFSTTADLGDIHTLLADPDIKAAKERVIKAVDDPTADVGDVMNDAFKDIIKAVSSNKPSMRNNGIAKMTRAGLLDKNQLVQFIGPRGFVKATDGTMYKAPITAGYADGLSMLSDSLTESRTASLSLYMNENTLKSSEYFNRQMQLLAGVISHIRGEDCGTTDTIPWLVSDTDLKSLAGKYRMVDGVAVPIDIKDTSLIDQLIEIRSMTKCRNEDPTTVCKVCFGQLHNVIPTKTNVGHFLTIEPLAAISQRILSTKHVVASMASLYLELVGTYKDWFKYDPENKSSIILKKIAPCDSFKLRFELKEAGGLNSIQACNDSSSLLPQRISCVTVIGLGVCNGFTKKTVEGDNSDLGTIYRRIKSSSDVTEEDQNLLDTVFKVDNWENFDVRVGGYGSALSSDVIAAIKRNGVTIDGDYGEVLLDNFKGKELFVTPRRNEDMISYLKQVEHFVFGGEHKQDKGDCIVSYNNCGQAVASLKRIFDEKINVNIVHAEILVRACMTVDGRNKDFNLPRGGDPFIFCNAKSIISNRSLSAALAYQRQRDTLRSPKSYLVKNRPSHPLDPLI